MGINDVNIDQMVSDVSARSQGQVADSGKNNPSNYSQVSDTAPQGDNSNQSDEALNLESVLKFKFGEREWTPDQLRKAIMLQSDYTKKTQQISEERKYFDNLHYDLENIRSNPDLVNEFMKVYPKQFHQYLKLVGANSEEAQNRQVQAQSEKAPIDPQLIAKLERVENYIRDTEVKAKEAELDAKFSSLSKKYPEGNEDLVLARAQALIDRGVPITDEVWDKLWKQSHDSFVSKFEAKQKQTLQQQRDSNNRASGPSSAGGVPTNAPRRESFKQATERAIQELHGRKF